MSFESIGLPEYFTPFLKAKGYTAPYPIQTQAIPAILNGKDILGIAKTGSGKTASYALPILAKLQSAFAVKNRHVQVLVVVPTRELAIQVQDVFFTFGTPLPKRIKTVAVYGGVSINPQMLALQNANIVVATPGRLLDLVKQNAIKLSSVRTFVLDEADKMLNLGFKDEMTELIKMLPAMRQNLLLSATLNPSISEIQALILNDPTVINIVEDQAEEVAIEQIAYTVEDGDKGPFLRRLIKAKGIEQVLIFTASVYQADHVANKLRKNGIKAGAIHSKKSQTTRQNVLEDFKDGKIKALVATDLLSRGIDIVGLPCVINYELPRSPKDYVHRIGRTGRAGEAGLAITLVGEDDQHHFKIIQKKMGQKVPQITADF